MRLKVLSQAPKDLTRHANTTWQPKGKRNPHITEINPANHSHKHNNEIFLFVACTIRGNQGGVRRTHPSVGNCLNPLFVPNTTYTTAPPRSIAHRLPIPNSGNSGWQRGGARRQNTTRDPQVHRYNTIIRPKVVALPPTPASVTSYHKPTDNDNPSYPLASVNFSRPATHGITPRNPH
jgi:hypothetical protein